MSRVSLYLSVLILTVFLSSCGRNCGCEPESNSISGFVLGKWKWVKTTTPSKTILAEDAGFTRTMEHSYDSKIGAYKIVFYKNDSLETNFLISKILDDDWNTKSMLLKYNGDAQLKIRGHFFDSARDDIDLEISEIMPDYNIEADTIRHFFKRFRP